VTRIEKWQNWKSDKKRKTIKMRKVRRKVTIKVVITREKSGVNGRTTGREEHRENGTVTKKVKR
jgi:hypothetical protein